MFYYGTPFTADDVVFRIVRVADESSDMKAYVTDCREVR